MPKNLGQLPHDAVIAFSGGSDSAFVLDFLTKGRRRLELAFFHHGTETSELALNFIRNEVIPKYNVPLHLGYLKDPIPKGESAESFWREKRYEFLHEFDKPVITAHHLDDCVETWIFSSLHGKPKAIAYSYGNIIRPFLLYQKHFMTQWCVKNKVSWIEDLTNLDVKYSRNRIRHNIVPQALKVNPGLHKVVARQVIAAASATKEL